MPRAVARNAARALANSGSAHQAIPDPLRALIDDDPGLREAAARALGNLAPREAVEPLARLACKGGPAGPDVLSRDQPRSGGALEPCGGPGGVGRLAEFEVLEVITAPSSTMNDRW